MTLRCGAGDGTIDYSELTQGIPSSNGDDKLDIITRLEYKFKKVDKDDTQTVDFFEFCYLALMMTQDGSYRDLVGNTRGASLAYRALISITTRFRALDVNKIQVRPLPPPPPPPPALPSLLATPTGTKALLLLVLKPYWYR